MKSILKAIAIGVGVAEVVGQDENESDKEHREKIEKLQAETEKQLDDLLEDLAK